MKSQYLHRLIMQDAFEAANIHSERDLKTFNARTTHEGQAFLESTLPRLDDHLLDGLRDGKLPRYCEGFSCKRGTLLPEFLYPLWVKVFQKDGYLRSDPSTVAIHSIRQIVRFQKRLFEVCSLDKVESAVRKYISTDLEVRDFRFPGYSSLPDVTRSLFAKTVAHVLNGDVTSRAKHGPGAVAEGANFLGKHSLSSFPPTVYRRWGIDHLVRGRENDLTLVDPVSKLMAVPKTADKPRIICAEPAQMMFHQQGVKELLEQTMFRSSVCSNEFQEPNQKLAQAGSVSEALATIDLSEASDRISWELVQHMFSWSPAFVRLLSDLRTPRIRYTLGEQERYHLLGKFAPAGSALTFPIEIMVFTAITAAAMIRQDGESVTALADFHSRSDVRVYGDDIIVPSHYVESVMLELERFGLVVNRTKSFWTGNFRESCGGDYFKGVSVKPTYLRKKPPKDRHDVAEIVSLSALRDQLFTQWPWFKPRTVRAIDKLILETIGKYPVVADPTATDVISRRGDLDLSSPLYKRRSGSLTIVVRGWRPELVRKPMVESCSELALRAWFMDHNQSDGVRSLLALESADVLRYTHQGRSQVVQLKPGWATAV